MYKVLKKVIFSFKKGEIESLEKDTCQNMVSMGISSPVNQIVSRYF